MKSDEELLQEAQRALDAVFKAIDEGWWTIEHLRGCPQDDTCECPGSEGTPGTARIASDALTEITERLRFGKGRRVALRSLVTTPAHVVESLVRGIVWFACGEHADYERLYEDKSVFAPGCHLCFPSEQSDYLPRDTHLTIHGKTTKNIGCHVVTERRGSTMRALLQDMHRPHLPPITLEVTDRSSCDLDHPNEEEYDANR